MGEDFVSITEEILNNVEKAKAFAEHPGKPVIFGGSPKSASKGQGSICFFVTEENHLKIDSQNEVMDGHNQNICIKYMSDGV